MQYDIAVVGAGLVGASLALSLHKQGFKVALIEAKQKTADDKRLFALNFNSIQLLQSLNVWSALASHATPIKEVHVSKQRRFGIVTLKHQDLGIEFLGQVVEACRIEEVLLAKLKEAQCEFLCPMQLIGLQENDAQVELKLQRNDSEMVLHASYVIGADGSNSMVRQLKGFVSEATHFTEKAIVAQIAVDRPHTGIAYERFFSDGVLALLPLQEKNYAGILTVDSNLAEQLLNYSKVEFLSYLQKLIGKRIGNLSNINMHGSYPIQFKIAKNAFSKRTILIGNALHTISPVAAQGFNLALFEITTIAREFSRAKKNQTEINLADIAKLFREQEVFSITVSRGLAKLSKSSIINDLALQMGFCAIEMLPFVKRKLLKKLVYTEGSQI